MKERNFALTIANLALEKQAHDLEIIDVSNLVDYADYVLVCGGRTERQVRAIAEAIDVGLKGMKHQSLGIEGRSQGHWVLMDYGSVIVHVFLEQARSYYDIEGLWMDAERVPVEVPIPQGDRPTGEQRGRCASG